MFNADKTLFTRFSETKISIAQTANDARNDETQHDK